MEGPYRLLCTVCESYRTNKLRDLLQHIRILHAHQPGLIIRCGIGGCHKTYSNFGTFQNHISAYHSTEQNPTNIAQTFDDLDDEDISDELHHELDPDEPEEQCVHVPLPDLQKSAALLLLKLKEHHKLTQKAVQVNNSVHSIMIYCILFIYRQLLKASHCCGKVISPTFILVCLMC